MFPVFRTADSPALQGVRAGVLGVLGQVDGGGGIVRACAGNHLYPVVHPLDAELHGGDVLPDGHGGRLAGGAADAHRVHTGLNLGIDQLAEGVIVDGALLVEGVTRAGQEPVKTGILIE